MTVGALVLAGGASRRMAPYNKLLLVDPAGRAMVARVVDNMLASRARPVVVVTGHQAAAIRAVLAGREVRFVHAADHAGGLSASLRAGLAAVPDTIEAVLVCLSDMPLVSGGVLDRLIGAYEAERAARVIVPVFRGQRGNPVLWDRRCFDDLLALKGDRGGRALFARYAGGLVEVAQEDAACLRDFDTVGSLGEPVPAARRA